MATIDWLATLPQVLLTNGYSQAVADNLLRSPMEYGPEKVRRRSSAGPRPVSGKLLMTSAELADFKKYYVETLLSGALRFNWVDPDDNSTAVEMRFKPAPSWVPRGLKWEVSMELEILP